MPRCLFEVKRLADKHANKRFRECVVLENLEGNV